MSLLSRLPGSLIVSLSHLRPPSSFASLLPRQAAATFPTTLSSSSSSSPFPLQHSQSRGYKPHTWDKEDRFGDRGRSVRCVGDRATQAYFRLRDIVQESKLREQVRLQERFERNPEKRRRKRKEKEWRTYMKVVKKRVQIAFDLKKRTAIERENYNDI
ncbi:hypothetical protein HKX48_003448 [Thoreauomyces humboldtii]|nr:hypothetical protein HKX48_003448 [Thoreauomyces humboldtii]